MSQVKTKQGIVKFNDWQDALAYYKKNYYKITQ